MGVKIADVNCKCKLFFVECQFFATLFQKVFMICLMKMNSKSSVENQNTKTKYDGRKI